MGAFRHTPDDLIYINNTVIPLAFFVSDLDPTYALPGGYTSRNYLQGSYNILSDGSTAVADTVPWTDGDTYITNEVAYAAAYAAYIAVSISVPQQKIITINKMLDYSTTIKNGYVVVTNTYFSDVNTLNMMIAEDMAYTRAAAVPVGYYLNDVNYVQRAIANVTDLEAIIDKITDLHYLCRLNEDVHRAAINALSTVSAILAYDYTTGWPTIPYP